MSARAPVESERAPRRRSHLPALRRRRRLLVVGVGIAFLLGVAGVSSDARRVLGGSDTPWLPEEGPGIRSPSFAYEFAGPAEDPLQRPVGISVFGGLVYVTDSLAGRISVFREGGSPRSTIGEERLEVPVGLTHDFHSSELLVTDRALGALFVYDIDGSFVETITPQPGSAEETVPVPAAWAPIAVAYADDGTLYVTDVAERHRVWHLTRSGEVLGVFPGGAPGEDGVLELDFPNAVVASDGRVWVADSNNRRLIEIDEAGQVVRSIPVGRLIRGLAMLPRSDAGERPHFALIDAFSHEVVLINDVGTEVGRVGGPGSGQGGLSFPNDVAVTTTGLYVSDTGNARVQVFEWIDGDGAGALVWPGGPSWLGLLSTPLLLAPLVLLLFLRPVKVVVSAEALQSLGAIGDAQWRWRKVRLVLTPETARATPPCLGPPIEVSDLSHSDTAALEAEFEFDEALSGTLSLALRHRVLIAENPGLAVIASARGVEVLDVTEFVEEFGLPVGTDDAPEACGDTEET